VSSRFNQKNLSKSSSLSETNSFRFLFLLCNAFISALQLSIISFFSFFSALQLLIISFFSFLSALHLSVISSFSFLKYKKIIVFEKKVSNNISPDRDFQTLSKTYSNTLFISCILMSFFFTVNSNAAFNFITIACASSEFCLEFLRAHKIANV